VHNHTERQAVDGVVRGSGGALVRWVTVFSCGARPLRCIGSTRPPGGMMTTPSVKSPVLVLIAISRIYPELRQRLTAAEWHEIHAELDSAIASLADSSRSAEHPAAVLTVVRLLSKSEAGREMLAGRLAAQDAILSLSDGSGETSAFYRVLAAADLDAPAATASSQERTITLKPGGLGGARSVKLKNFHLDFVELLKIGSSSLASLSTVLSAPNPLVIASSVLTIVQSLVASATKTIGEDEASLFWSFIQTAGQREDKIATEAEVWAASKKDRRAFGLAPFKKAEFTETIKALEGLSSIAPEGQERWRLTESYRVTR
jgi:hypothetical protein